ncbi:MAG: zf-HC2 domain-containing protein [Silvibacterium sp.]|nr:zf-HC2 domain-containing protein [Silvibacterium sp.]
MSERNPFEQHPKGPEREHGAGRELRCEEWEALLADALDGMMPAAESASFETHSHSCAACAGLLAQSRQGQEWMRFLHFEPEPPADLMEHILGRTSGAVAERPLAVYGAPIPAGPGILPLPRRRFVWDTRMMMTAAMAFFSIALTLNLAGVQLTHLKLSDLTPASIESNLTRQFYGAKSQLVRYYDNLRFVYEVESKMRELRRDEETPRPAAKPQQNRPAPQSAPAGGSSGGAGNGHKTGGRVESTPAVPEPDVIFGPKTLARAGSPDTDSSTPLRGEEIQASCPRAHEVIYKQNKNQEVYTLIVSRRYKAERGLA